MADDRNCYKGQVITLELHEDDVSGSFSTVDQVIIFQDKEICYSTTSIILLSPGVWSITVNTNDVLYTGDFNDRWILDGGSRWVQKSVSIVEAISNIPVKSTGNYTYYSKDLCWGIKSDGDLDRLYDNYSISAKMEAVIMTIKGSLFNEPLHGTYLYRFLFASISDPADAIRLELEVQLQQQVPQIKISQIDVEPTDRNAYTVRISFYNEASANPLELLNMTNLVSVEQVIGA
jgi:hypothetical protein